MNPNVRVPPSYVPTLTEVVHVEPQAPAPASLSDAQLPKDIDLDALTDRVLAQLTPRLTQHLEERFAARLLQWADEQSALWAHETAKVLDEALEPIVRETLAQTLSNRSGAN